MPSNNDRERLKSTDNSEDPQQLNALKKLFDQANNNIINLRPKYNSNVPASGNANLNNTTIISSDANEAGHPSAGPK